MRVFESRTHSSRSTARLRRGLEDFRGLVSLFRVRHDRRRGKRVAVGVWRDVLLQETVAQTPERLLSLSKFAKGRPICLLNDVIT